EEMPRLSPAAGGPTGPTPPPRPSGRFAIPTAAPSPPRPAAPPASAIKAPAAGTGPAVRAAPSAQAAPATPRPQPVASQPLPASPRAEPNPFAHLFGGFDAPAERPQKNVYATAASRAAATPLPVAPPPAILPTAFAPPAAKSGKGTWVAVAVAVLLAVAAGAYAAWYVSRGRSPAGSGPPAADTAPAARQLKVARDAKAGDLRTIKEALGKAKPGDEILLLDEVHEEPSPITLTGDVGKGVTIASGLAAGRPVTWRLPPTKTAEWLIEVNSCEGVKLKGLVLDGRGMVDTPLRLVGLCPGASVEDVLVQKFKKAGVKLANCGGEQSRPVALRRVRATAAGTGEADAALVLFASANMTRPKANEHVIVRDCVFDGPFKSAVRIEGAAEDVAVERCRVYRAGEGVRCEEPKGDQLVHVKFVGNTFADMKDAVALPAVSNDGRIQIAVRQNLFVKCGTVLKAEKGPVRQFVSAEVNGRDKETKDGQLPTPAKEYTAEFVSTDPAQTGFLSYPRTSPLAKAGLNQTPVGVPAD
ncbi:MAG TPA: hypothetical protein VGF55_20230, partial [Gemmataceae bacterium]